MCCWEEGQEKKTHRGQGGDLVPDLLEEHRELVQAERVVRVRVVQIEQLAHARQVLLAHWDALLDPVDHRLPLAVVDLAVVVLVRLVDELEEVRDFEIPSWVLASGSASEDGDRQGSYDNMGSVAEDSDSASDAGSDPGS